MSLLDKKTILVTGATGLIGSNLVHRLMQRNTVNVTVLARNKEKVLDLFSDYLKKSNFKYIIQDITEPIQSTDTFDYIFHAAGSISGNVIKNYPIDVIMANLQGTINCLELLKQQRKGRLVIFSSATVYGNCDKNRTVKEANTELTDSLDNSICAYSQSKRMIETLARAYHTQHNTDVVIVRFSYVFGYTKYYPNTAIFNFIQKSLNGEDIILNGINFPKRDNIYVDDAIEMLLKISESGNSGEAYNISSNGENGNYAAIDEIAEKIVQNANELTKLSVKLIKKPFKDSERLPGLLLDNTKVRSMMTCKREKLLTSMQDAILQTIKKFHASYKQENKNL